MEIILTVLITLGVVALLVAVWGVIRLSRRVDDLDVGRLDIDDDIEKLRKELEDDIEHLHRENDRIEVESIRNLDKRLDNVWSEIHKLDKLLNPNKDLLKS